jgi:hypothetical protein
VEGAEEGGQGMSLFCLLFWHRWRPQAAQASATYNGPEMKELNSPSRIFTRVLYRCERCPAHRVCEFPGKWSLEQLVLGEEMHDSPPTRVDA